MSDVTEGPGWWLASDGKWYPPDPSAHLDQPVPPSTDSTGPADVGPPNQFGVPSRKTNRRVIDVAIAVVAVALAIVIFRAVTSRPSTQGASNVASSAAGIPFVGLQWNAPVHVDPFDDQNAEVPLVAISCLSTSFCMTIDSEGNAFEFNGTSWNAVGKADTGISDKSGAGLAAITSLSCASPSSCMAMDGQGRAFHYVGSTWSAPVVVFQGRPLSGSSVIEAGVSTVSCPAISFCMAANSSGVTNSWNGATWGSPPALKLSASSILGGGINSVSCPTTQFCMSADTSGHVYQWLHGTWSGPSNVDSKANNFSPSQDNPTGFGDVTCPAADSCIAVDSNNRFFTWDGHTWSSEVANGSVIASITCPTSSFCLAGTESTDYLTWANGSWSNPSVNSQTDYLGIVSCASAQFCVGVDQGGNALVGNASK